MNRLFWKGISILLITTAITFVIFRIVRFVKTVSDLKDIKFADKTEQINLVSNDTKRNDLKIYKKES